MQQDKNIDKKIQQLENQQLPDLSQMDAHWQQMQAMLKPQTKPGTNNRWFWYLLAACFIGATIFFIIQPNKTEKNISGAVVENKQNEKSTAGNTASGTVTVVDTVSGPGSNAASSVQYSLAINPALIPPDDDTSRGIYMDTLKLRVIDCGGCPDTTTKTITLTSASRQQKLQGFFDQLAKKGQEFMIDNTKDTLITCTEGTSLLIPAYSLGGNRSVTFTIKEFYKESDIVLNQLSTISNKEQLVTGGMFQMTASVNGREVNVAPQKPIRLFMADTSEAMKGMQLFNGSMVGTQWTLDKLNTDTFMIAQMNNTVNWAPQNQFFLRKVLVTDVKVLDLRNDPYKERLKRKYKGWFYMSKKSVLTRPALADSLKRKYGYDKVTIRNSRQQTENHSKYVFLFKDRYFESVGDSGWVNIDNARSYNLVATDTMRYFDYQLSSSAFDDQNAKKISKNEFDIIRDKYSVDLQSLGWINCDRFFYDPANKIDYVVDLGDSADCNYTVMVFNNIKSVMSGVRFENKVKFYNVPEGQPVTVISVIIDKKGETWYSMKAGITNKKVLAGFQFELVTANELKSSLSKLDK